MKKQYLLFLFVFLTVNMFAQTANVFWSVAQDDSPNSFPVATADISMTDGVNPAITLAYDSANFIELMLDVPYGTYDYTIITDVCLVRTGQVFVDDSTLDPNNPTPTVPVFEVQGDGITDIVWTVNETSDPSSDPVATANITMTDGVNPDIILAYDSNNSIDVMEDVPHGTYDYTISTLCHDDRTGSVTVNCDNLDPSYATPTIEVMEVQGGALTTANVFWTVNETSGPGSDPVATADITMTDGVNPSIVLAYNSNNSQDVMEDVPLGTYDYTISTLCHEDRTGTVTVDCANLDPNNPVSTVAVVEVQGDELTLVNVFWNVSETSAPNSLPVTTADISMTDGVNPPITLAYDSNNFQDVMADVPFGTYDYTISTECHEDRMGTVTVDCANVDPNNPIATVAVMEVQGDEFTTANVFWNVNETSDPNSFQVSTAFITMTDGINPAIELVYDPINFQDVMENVPFGTYDYTISTECHEDQIGTLSVDCANLDPNNPTPTVAVWEVQGNELTMANVFWNVNETSDPNSFPVTTAEITMTDGIDTYSLEYTEFVNLMQDVPFGTYDYTISTLCHEDRIGTVTVDCANIDPNNPVATVAVWEVQGEEFTTANVFWNVNEDSSPMSFPVATAEITITDGVNPPIMLAYDSNNFQDVMADVPFGTYDYTISTECHEDRTGTVTVDCANIDPNNPIATVAVWEVQGDELAIANVFWNVNEDSSPMSFPVATAEITITDGVNPPIMLAYDSNNFQDVMADVPFGTYDYTISTECHEDRTGSVTVDCANIDPNNLVATVAVWEVQGDELTTANVFWNVNEDSSPMSFPVATAEITITDGVNPPIMLAYDSNNFQDVMADIPFGTYDYTISTECHEDRTGSVTVDCANIDPNNPVATVAVWEVQGDELTTANVFWNVNENSSPMSFPVVTADITMTDGVNTYSLTYSEFDNIMTDVPFGTYDYTISTDCHEDRTGTVTVDCANIDPNNPTATIAVWEVQGDGLSTPNVFWNVNETSDPNSFPVATADITMTNGVNTYSLTYSEFDNLMEDVVYGTYSYTISTECHADRTGTVIVDCANLDPNNPIPTVAVWEVQGDLLTAANVFWSVNEDNSPMSFPVPVANITMSDGLNPAITLAYDSNNFQDVMPDVPFGTYDYTISIDCREDVSGTITVDCASTDPNNPTPTVASFQVQGDEIEVDVMVNQNDAVLTANENGINITYQWIDCDNGNTSIAGETSQSFTATVSGNYAVVISNSGCSIPETSECIQVTITSTLETDKDILSAALFPNPVDNNLTIKFENYYQNIQINLFSFIGQLLKTVEVENSHEVKLNMSGLPSGNYLVKLNADEKTISSIVSKK